MAQASNVADMAFALPRFKTAKIPLKETGKTEGSFDRMFQKSVERQETKSFEKSAGKTEAFEKLSVETKPFQQPVSEAVKTDSEIFDEKIFQSEEVVEQNQVATSEALIAWIASADFVSLKEFFAKIAGNIEDAEQTQDGKEESILNILQGLFTKVEELLLETLNLTEEDLKLQMEAMGIGLMDLSNPDILKQFVVQTLGKGDIASLLTNENLTKQLEQLTQEILPLLDQIKEVMAKLTEVKFPATLWGELEQKEAGQENVSQPSFETEKPDLELNKKASFLQTETRTKENPEVAENKMPLPEEQKSVSAPKAEISDEIEFQTEKISLPGDTNSEENASAGKQNGEQGALQFLQNMQAAMQPKTAVQTSEFFDQMETIREIARQITEQIKVVVKPDTTSLELQLQPEHLGKVLLNITSKEGIMTAQFTTQTQVAKEALESQLQILQQNIERQGLKVEAVEVTVGSFDFAQSKDTSGQHTGNSGQGSKNSKRKTGIASLNADSEPVLNETNAHLAHMMETNGTVVDYSA